MRKQKLLLTVISLLTIYTSKVFAQAGSLDLSFGNNGIVTTDLGGTDHADAVVIQPDGKILVAGQKDLSVPSDIALVRYNIDGSLDNTFGINGHVITDVTGNSDVAWAICLQPDGKILVGGSFYRTYNEDVGVMRYNVDGSLDSTFGINGVTLTDVYGTDTTDFSDNNDYGWAMALQADGKIVVGGYSSDEGMDHNLTVFRYNSNGILDSTFDFDGIAITPMGLPLHPDEIRGLAIQPDGKILAAGGAAYSASSGYQHFVLVRYNTDGSLDNSFDNDGMVNTLIGNFHSTAYSMILQPNSKIVVAGVSYDGVNVDFALARYLSNGYPDFTFDGDGKVVTPVGPGSSRIFSVNIQPDGKIITCGNTSYNNIPANFDIALTRYNVNGSLDTTFDSDGILTTSIGSSYAIGYSMALQADGKIVVAGWSNNALTSDDITLVRYNNNIVGLGLGENSLNGPLLYPNPTTGKFYIENTNNHTEISIRNILGTEVYKDNLGSQTTCTINLTDLANGIYTVKLTSGTKALVQKIIKQQ